MDSGNREFSTPKLFHYVEPLTEKQTNNLMSTDNARRNVQINSLCDLSVVENSHKESEPFKSTGFLSTKKNFNLEPEKRRHTNFSNRIMHSFAQENQEIQTQKLKGGKIRQTPCIGTRHSPHKARASSMMTKPKLMQTRPTNPAFKTSQTVCLGNIRSSAVQTPKFERRPLIRKSAEATTVVSVETTPRNYQRKPYLTTPKVALRTSLTARKPKIEIEQQEKVSNFKARPLNKKILESKGELGLFCNKKRQVTIPQEFHFATNKRIPPKTPDNAELFGKITSCLGSHKKKPIPRKTVPRPFQLHTEKRGEQKESKLVAEIIHKHIQEEQPRILASSSHPYTSDYYLVPSKTESRHCTKPEDEDASMRAVTAETTLKEDSNAVPERVGRPLTEVQELSLHRTELDSKLKEKKMMEEIGLKQLKKSSVLHAKQVPSFEQPFSPQKSSKGVTKSMSPSSNVSVRKAGLRKIVVATATSSAASNMR